MRNQSLIAHELLCLHLKAYYSIVPCGPSLGTAGKQLPSKNTARKVGSTHVR
jgi:hypothetical protein